MKILILLLITFFGTLFSEDVWFQTYWEIVPTWNGYDTLLIDQADVFKIKGTDTALISGTDSVCSSPIDLVRDRRRPVKCSFWFLTDRQVDGSVSSQFDFEIQTRQLFRGPTFSDWVGSAQQYGDTSFPVTSFITSNQYVGNDPVTSYARFSVEGNQIRICPSSSDGAESLLLQFLSLSCY